VRKQRQRGHRRIRVDDAPPIDGHHRNLINVVAEDAVERTEPVLRANVAEAS
jgi:hypothetical protein